MKDSFKTFGYYAFKVGLGAFAFPYFRLCVVGRERVPRHGAVMFAANHFSYADPPLLGIAMPRRIRFVMSEEMFRKPSFYAFSRLMDVVPVTAGGAFQPSSIKKVMRLLKGGDCVGIFPEGTRSRTGRLQEAQRGVGLFAKRGGAVVVPVAIVGTREAWPPGVLLPRPRKVRIFVGEPIPPDAEATPEGLAARAQDAIAALLLENGCEDYVEAGPPTEEERAP